MWKRGLKLSESVQLRNVPQVAPRVGAWIETSSLLAPGAYPLVAPRMGRGLKLSTQDGLLNHP